MAFDPVQEDCLRLILAAMEREGAQRSRPAHHAATRRRTTCIDAPSGAHSYRID